MITITIAELEKDFDDIMDDVIENGTHYIITDNDGKKSLVLMPYDKKISDFFSEDDNEENE
jgi:PHD/YefM family antitoxin component YafN of YafNO toxin-antitoxin module